MRRLCAVVSAIVLGVLTPGAIGAAAPPPSLRPSAAPGGWPEGFPFPPGAPVETVLGPCGVNLECWAALRLDTTIADACAFWDHALPQWGAAITARLDAPADTGIAIRKFNRAGARPIVGNLQCSRLRSDTATKVSVMVCYLPPRGETERCAIAGARPG